MSDYDYRTDEQVYAVVRWRRNWKGKVQWRSTIYGLNNEPLFRSTEGYDTKRACVDALMLVNPSMPLLYKP